MYEEFEKDYPLCVEFLRNHPGIKRINDKLKIYKEKKEMNPTNTFYEDLYEIMEMFCSLYSEIIILKKENELLKQKLEKQ